MSRPSAWTCARAICLHELRLLLYAPAAWVFFAGFLVAAALFFLLALASGGEASLRDVLPNWAVVLVFCVPFLTMRQLAWERRSGTLELLWTAPVPLGALILGKWAATCLVCALLLGLTLPMPAALVLYGNPDPAVLGTSYLGLVACCAAFAAAGLFASSLTRDPMVAGVGGALILLPFWVAGSAVSLVGPGLRPWLIRASVGHHLRSFAAGAVDLGDGAWFLGFCATFLFLTWRSLEARRWA